MGSVSRPNAARRRSATEGVSPREVGFSEAPDLR